MHQGDMDEPTFEKYAISTLSSFVFVPVLGYVVGKIIGTGFGDIFILGIYVLLIVPLWLVLTVIGFPIFKWVTLVVKAPYFVKILLSGTASMLVPLLAIPFTMHLIFNVGNSTEYFYKAYLVAFLISAPFLFVAAITYVLLEKYA